MPQEKHTHMHAVCDTFQRLPLILGDTNMKGLLKRTPGFIVERHWFTHPSVPQNLHHNSQMSHADEEIYDWRTQRGARAATKAFYE